ncbi:hypothetical protein ACFL21_01895 [Patescibacteria group bacterium]
MLNSDSSGRLERLGDLEQDFDAFERMFIKAKRAGDKEKMHAIVDKISGLYSDEETIQKIVKSVFGMRVLNPESFEQMYEFFKDYSSRLSEQMLSYFSENPQIQTFLDSFKITDRTSLIIQQLIFYAVRHISENRSKELKYDKNVQGIVNFVFNLLAYPEIVAEFEEYLNTEVRPFMNDKNTTTLPPGIKNIRDLFSYMKDPQFQGFLDEQEGIKISDDFAQFLFNRGALTILKLRHYNDAQNGDIPTTTNCVSLETSSGRELELEFDEDVLGNSTNLNLNVHGTKDYSDIV